MPQESQSLLERIRNSDTGTKKRWVAGTSIAAMAIVLILWLSYMNSVVKPNLSANQTSSTDQTIQEFWPVLRKGWGIVSGLTKDKIQSMMSSVMAGHSITIDNQQNGN